MKKLITVFLSVTLCIGTLSAQQMDGNYNIDSLVVKYVMVTRDMNQEVGGQTYVTDYDANLSNYGLRVRYPSAADDDMQWEFELPLFGVGDTIRTTDVALPTPAHLAGATVTMNVDFDGTNGTYTFNEGSTYPTTQTVDCVTGPVIPSVQDQGTWTDGGFGQDGSVVTQNPLSVYTGWGIITSGVFASFQAPNMATMTYGTDYGMTAQGTATAMPNWGYMKVTYAADNLTPAGLHLGWEAHDGPDAGIGIVSTGDQFFNQTEADLGLLNGVVGIGELDIDSVTIGNSAVLAASGATITVPAPTATDPTATHTYDNDALANGIAISTPDQMAYMFNGPGQVNPATGQTVLDSAVNTTTGQMDYWPLGQFSGTKAYVFDPTGDLLGGGDGLPFSGDEALKFTGYYATWNTLQTILAMTEGTTNAVTAAIMATTPPNPAALPTADDLAAAIMDAVLWQWDIQLPATVTAPALALLSAQFTTDLTALMTEAMTTTPTLEMAKAAVSGLLPYILGALTGIEYNPLTEDLFTDTDGDPMTVDDSDWDLDSDEWYWWSDSTVSDTASDGTITVTDLPYIDADGSINGTYYGGGRLFVELDANCIPARWSQYVDSHWSYTGAIASVDEGIVAEKFELKGNYPNPFNPTTKIRFTNDRTANVRVNVYSLLGEKVNTLMNKQINSGTYDVSWNGLSSQGKIVSSGMYIYEIESEGRRLKGKMLFLK